ncbi:MAG: hypothetical protein Q9209_002832 [Squamulea sp. 1 TL-2023]
MSRKRSREKPSIDTQLVEIYEDLANEDEKIRFKAAHAFLTKFSPRTNHSNEQLSEAVRRLVRGLCSGRKAARIGFSIALTEFLSQQWGDPNNTDGTSYISQLIDVLIKQTETTGDVAGQEERDHQFGRLFGAEAFFKSGILLQVNAPSNAWERTLDAIYEAAKKKPWLREECGWILYGAAQTISEGDHDLRFIQVLVNKLVKSGLAKTPEGIAIWLKVQIEFPEIELPTDIWRGGGPLLAKHKLKLAKILKETTSAERPDEKKGEMSQRGSWTSRIHFAWNVILSELTKEKHTQATGLKSETLSLEEFWQVAVDEHLFASTSSDERKYWGFLLFQQVFGGAPRIFLQALFSPNFMRCLTNQLASKERYLHRAAERTIKTIMKRANLEPSVAAIAMSGLLADSLDKTLSFDSLTKTKTVDRLMALSDDLSLRHFVPKLCDKLVRPGVIDEKDATARRQITINLLTSVLKSRQSNAIRDIGSSAATDPTCHILEVFATYSYFVIEKSHFARPDCPVPPMSGRTQDTLRTRLSSCLSYILSRKPNPALFASHVVGVVLRHEIDEQMHSVLDFTSALKDTISKARAILDKVQNRISTESSDKTTLHAFELLYSLTLLQVYNGDADAVSMLNELRGCYNLLIERRQVADRFGSETLIEILLSFVAKPSQLFRRLAQQVFSAFSSNIQRDDLQSMIKVLETKENLSGQNEMFEDEAGHSSDAASSTDGSDVEEVDMTNGNGAPASTSNDNGSEVSRESDNNQDNSGEEDEELAAFEMKLAQALKTRPLNVETDEAGNEESTDEDMDDNQMEALDEHIASMFKARKRAVSKKKQKVDARETIVNFKCRVLELLEIFVQMRHTDVLALDLLVPLLIVTRTTTSSLVSSKACNVMRDFSKLCKSQEVPQIVDKAAIVKLLREVHIEAMWESSNAHASACSQASLLLVKILVADDRENLRLVVKVYGDTQVSLLMDPNCRVKTSFFTDWLNWCNTARPAR